MASQVLDFSKFISCSAVLGMSTPYVYLYPLIYICLVVGILGGMGYAEGPYVMKELKM